MVGTVASLPPKVVEQLPLGALDPQEHIANLKEAAKGEQEDGAAAAANGNGNGHSSDSGSSQAAGATGRTAYLPPPEIARTIPCRFFPKCTYGSACIFFHPPSAASAAPAGGPGLPLSSSTEDGAAPATTNASANGNGSAHHAVNGNGVYANGNGYEYSDAQAHQQQQMYDYSAGYPQAQPYPQMLYANGYGDPSQQGGDFNLLQSQYGATPSPLQFIPHHPQQQAVSYYGGYPTYHPSQQQQQHYPTNVYAQQQYVPQQMGYGGPYYPQSQQYGSPYGAPHHFQQQQPTSSSPPKAQSMPQQQPMSNGNGASTAPVSPPAESTEMKKISSSGSTESSKSASKKAAKAAQTSQAADPSSSSAPADGQGASLAVDAAPSQEGQQDAPTAQSAAEAAPAAKTHERTSSAQMRTLYQTGNANGGDAPLPASQVAAAGPADASTQQGYKPQQGGPSGFVNGHGAPGKQQRSFAPNASVGRPGPAGPAGGKGPFLRHYFDPSRPLPACRYFGEGSCRFGDKCAFGHQLNQPRPIPGDAEGRMTSDAKVLNMRIVDPQGNVDPGNGYKGRANGAFRPFPGAQQQQPARANGVAGEAAPFVRKEGAGILGNPEEQLQRLISEMPRQASLAPQGQNGPAKSSLAAPANGSAEPAVNDAASPSTEPQPSSQPVPAQPNGSAAAAPRSNPIPPTLGHRPAASAQQKPNGPMPNGVNRGPAPARQHPAARPNNAPRSQRIPDGENDFPALAKGAPAPANGSAPSAESSTPAPPAPANAPASGKDDAAPAQKTAQSQPAQAAQASASSAKTAAASSWASRAAKAASLPDPPKRAPSKPRTAAAHPNGAEAPAEEKKQGDALVPVAPEAAAAMPAKTIETEAAAAPAVKA